MHALNYLGKTVFIIAQILFMIFIVRVFIVDVGRVNGRSMYPTFGDSEIFLVNRSAYLLKAPERYDIIQHIHPEKKETLLVKRVIALPNETIEFKNGEVIVSDQEGNMRLLHEEYIPDQGQTYVNFGAPTLYRTLPDEYFVIGDNRRGSGDSRNHGPIKRKVLIGKVYKLPFSK